MENDAIKMKFADESRKFDVSKGEKIEFAEK